MIGPALIEGMYLTMMIVGFAVIFWAMGAFDND